MGPVHQRAIVEELGENAAPVQSYQTARLTVILRLREAYSEGEGVKQVCRAQGRHVGTWIYCESPPAPSQPLNFFGE